MIDKKCLKCKVRRFALDAVQILRMYYELNERMLDVLESFDTGYAELNNRIPQDCYDVVIEKK